MVNTSKILTVSYGTFSCTLEGFDDSFETMKAIAEYFRDLAADDRYFGAEPPTPDADMLARIAEREIARQVEARQDQGGIVLRAAEAASLATPAEMATPAPDQATDVYTPDAGDAAQDLQPAEEASAAQPEAGTEYTPAAPGDVVFQQPAIADPVVTQTANAPAKDVVAEPPVETAETVVDEAADDMVADTVVDDQVAPAEETVETVEPVPDMAAEMGETDDSAADGPAIEDDDIETAEEFFQNSPGPDAPTVYESETVEELVADPESITAKLTRIRSVVLQNDQPEEQEDYSEDEHAQDFLSETAAELGAALAMDDVAELNGADTFEEDSETSEQQVAGDEVEAPVAETSDAAGGDDLKDVLSRLAKNSVPEDAESRESIEINDENQDDQPSAEVIDETEASEADADVSDHDEMPARLSARMRRGQNTEADAATTDEMVNDDRSDDASDLMQSDASTAVDVSGNDQSLTPEQEEELQRELAEVEADLLSIDMNDDDSTTDAALAEADEDAAEADLVSADADEEVDEADLVSADADEDAGEAREPAQPSSARDGRHKFETADGQTDISRIFDEADSQLEKPESNQRRSAIQHLRAAVAATRAEKKAGSDLEKGVDDTPYRSDLASVVRPNRPNTAEGARSERPVEARPAPLKLVAEQRVDIAQEPIRPRRIAATESAGGQEQTAEEGDNSFSDYAREMGATQLPDLLEAAAAYMSDVEGRSQFSRPMLMHKVAEIERENFSREDGLRSFGQLLRDGKIQKIKGGRFTVTDETEFRGDRRHAG